MPNLSLSAHRRSLPLKLEILERKVARAEEEIQQLQKAIAGSKRNVAAGVLLPTHRPGRQQQALGQVHATTFSSHRAGIAGTACVGATSRTLQAIRQLVSDGDRLVAL